MRDLRKAAADTLEALERFHQDGYNREDCGVQINALRAALAQEAEPVVPSCPTCGTHEVSFERICHNSKCDDYGRQHTTYEGWRKPPPAAPAVTDAMVEAARRVWIAARLADATSDPVGELMRAAIEAALAAKGGG